MSIRAAHAATKITVGRCRWWGLHKFGVPIKMISLSLRDKMIEQGDDMRRQLAAMVQANKALADGFQGMAQAQERQHENFLRGLEGQNKALIQGLQGLATALAGRR